MKRTLHCGLTLLLTLLGSAGGPEAFAQKPKGPGKGPGRPQLVQDVGGHTGIIYGLAFSPDGRRLYTGGIPGEVAEWEVDTGRRLRVWRFFGVPGPVVVSANGKRLATTTLSGPDKRDSWLIDLDTGDCRRGPILDDSRGFMLAISPDGKRVAVNYKEQTEIHDAEAKARGTPLLTLNTGYNRSMTFAPKGTALVTAAREAANPTRAVLIWNVTPQSKKVGAPLPDAEAYEAMATWATDSNRIAAISSGDKPSLVVWSMPDRKVAWKADVNRLRKEIGEGGGDCRAEAVAFLGGNVVAACWEQDGWLKVVRVNLDTSTMVLLPTAIRHRHIGPVRVAFSPDGRWLAATTDPAFQVAVYDLKLRQQVRSLGPSVEVPRVVGWKAKGHGIAWGYEEKAYKVGWQKALSRGLNLDTLEPMSSEEFADAASGRLPNGWRLVQEGEDKTFVVSPGKKVLIHLFKVPVQPRKLFKDAGGKPWLVVVHKGGQYLAVVDPETGKSAGQLGGRFNQVHDLALSPDEKYLLVAGGDLALHVFSLNTRRPLLNLLPRERDWIAWAPRAGYYAATPGGEKLVGWKVKEGEDRPAAFYPAERFRKRLYRPDVISRLLPAGELKAALNAVQVAREAVVDEMLPPQVSVELKQDGAEKEKVTVTAKATASGKSQPVEALRLLIDGRPVQGKSLARAALRAEAEWKVEVPAGKHELKVLARCADVSGISDPQVVSVPVKAADRPALHVLAVGLNHMGNRALDLKGPKQDAEKIEQQFQASCVGAGNLFGKARSKCLVDKDATRKAVLDELRRIRKGVKPGDLVVFFFAGHGVRDGGKFYLLTHGSNLNGLAGTALSGKDLYDAMKELPCQVLVLLDACHSGAGARVLRQYKPATDDAARDLADEECAVTVLAAAMGHERALEPQKGGHGLFTEALLGALRRNAGVPYNVRDGRQYVHHLFSHVFDDVKDLSKDKQHPFLSLPWTSESFPVRQVAKGEEK